MEGLWCRSAGRGWGQTWAPYLGAFSLKNGKLVIQAWGGSDLGDVARSPLFKEWKACGASLGESDLGDLARSLPFTGWRACGASLMESDLGDLARIFLFKEWKACGSDLGGSDLGDLARSLLFKEWKACGAGLGGSGWGQTWATSPGAFSLKSGRLVVQVWGVRPGRPSPEPSL